MSTIRDDGVTIGSGVTPGDGDGTVRSGSGDISSGFRPNPGNTVPGVNPKVTSGMNIGNPLSAGVSLNPGDPLVINSVNYQYEGVISQSTGEAEIFLLSTNKKKCVLKLYYPSFKAKEDIVKKLKQLNHDDIINVLDYGFYEHRFFEIMDYAEGGTLDKYVPIKEVPRLKQVIAETVNAYKFCHENGIVHKDIKPQNIYYKNADGTDILIGDFGISTSLDSGQSRHLTSQALTFGYAAPEMYGIGGKVYIGAEVDYYALGITLIHVWDGKSPFEGLIGPAISNLTTSGKVPIPGDMPEEIKNLIKGLITVDYTKRWGYDEVKRWLNGEDVPVHFFVQEFAYPPYQFSPNEFAGNPKELADLLMKNPDTGKKRLYSGKISKWVNTFNQGLSSDLDSIVEDEYAGDQEAGTQKAVYILDPERGPIVQGKEYKTTQELADVLENHHSQFSKELENGNHAFYLYLEAHEAEKEANVFRKYFKTFTRKKALNTVILELRGRDALKLDNKLYSVPEELLSYSEQQYLVTELIDLESQLSLWIEGSNFSEIKKQVKEWRTMGWHDEGTLAYALSENNTRLLPKETFKRIDDNYIIPGDLKNGLRKKETWEFFRAVDEFLTLQSNNKLLTQPEYQTFKTHILPKPIQQGLKGKKIDSYIQAVESLRDLGKKGGLKTRKQRGIDYFLTSIALLLLVMGVIFRNEIQDFVKITRNSMESSPEENYLKGLAFEKGKGVIKNIEHAVELYKKAADQGHIKSQLQLGHFYKKGPLAKRNLTWAAVWYQKAADQGEAAGQYYLGTVYEKKDFKKAIPWYQKAADQNFPLAQVRIGRVFSEGRGVKKDYKKAVKWYQKAADQKYSPALYELGYASEKGRGVKKDFRKAMKLYRDAADLGNAKAQYRLGYAFSKGQMVKKDLTEAAVWYRKSAHQGNAKGQYRLGYAYKHGLGIIKNPTMAVKWYKKAAKKGHTTAEYSLAYAYEHGHGVKKDIKKAKKWYLKAANAGHVMAKAALKRVNFEK